MSPTGILEKLINSDSLINTGRTARKPIISWLDELLQKIEAISTKGGRIASDEFSSVQNNFSLLTLLIKGASEARIECAEQIRHAIREDALDQTLQPWVNLARLDRIEGDIAASEKKLSAMLRLALHGRVVLGRLDIGSDSDKRFAANVFASESFHLALHNMSKLPRHFKRLDHLFGCRPHPLFAEQQIIAGTLLGNMVMVDAGLTSRAWFADSRTRLAGMYYRAVWALQHGNHDLTDRFVHELLRLPPATTSMTPDHVMVRILFRGALLSSARGDAERAILLLRYAKDYAACIFDAEYSARVGAELERLGEATAWKDMAAKSGYRSFRGLPPFADGRYDNDVAQQQELLRERIHALRCRPLARSDGEVIV